MKTTEEINERLSCVHGRVLPVLASTVGACVLVIRVLPVLASIVLEYFKCLRWKSSSSCVHGSEGGKTRAAASCAGDPAIFSLLSFIKSPLSLFNNHLLSFITYFHNPISLPCQSNQQLDEPKCFTLPCIADAVQRLMKCYLLLGACCCKTSLLCFLKRSSVRGIRPFLEWRC